MIIGVPTFALIYSMIGEIVRERLKRNDMPSETFEYEKIDHITVQEEIVYREPEENAPDNSDSPEKKKEEEKGK